MRIGFLACLPGLLVGASLVLGQPPQGPMPEAPPVEGESKPAPAEPADAGPEPPHPGVLDGLTSHFDGTCGHLNGGVVTADVDYLLWVLRDASVPVALASTTSTNALGITSTPTLIGQHDLRYYHRPSSGVRVSLAYWQEDPLPQLDWDRPRTVGVEANYLFLGERGITMRNDTTQTLFRPFFSQSTNSQALDLVAAAGIASGGVTASANYGLWGTELNLWKNIYYEYPGKTIRLDVLAGFRYLDLGEDLSASSLTVFSQNPGAGLQAFAGQQILINDLLGTRDQFYGGQLGAVAKFFLDAFDLSVACKLAFGENAEEVHIDGFQLRNGKPILARGGLLALPSNIGRFHGTQFAVVPEFDVIASLAICRHVSLAAGYNFLYWSRVVRPGDQIDPVINVNQIPTGTPINTAPGGVMPGVARPIVPFKETDFWAQGLTVGLRLVW